MQMRRQIGLLLLACSFVAAKSQDGNLANSTYVRFGWALPSWKYYGWDDKTDWNESIRRTGAILEIGTIYMLNGVRFADDMGIGIHVDYLSFAYHRFQDTDTDYSNHFVFVGTKIGPSFSYSPVNKLVLDAYFKFNPVWATGSLVLFNQEGMEDRAYGGFLKLKYSVGFNVRYGIAMLGFDFNPGAVKLREYDVDEKEFTENYLGNTNAGDKTPVPGINLTLGLCF